MGEEKLMNIDERVCAATAAALLGFTGVASAAPADDLERMGMEAVARADFATAESLFAQAREAGGRAVRHGHGCPLGGCVHPRG